MWVCKVTAQGANGDLRKFEVKAEELDALRQIVADLNYTDVIEEHYFREV